MPMTAPSTAPRQTHKDKERVAAPIATPTPIPTAIQTAACRLFMRASLGSPIILIRRPVPWESGRRNRLPIAWRVRDRRAKRAHAGPDPPNPLSGARRHFPPGALAGFDECRHGAIHVGGGRGP